MTASTPARSRGLRAALVACLSCALTAAAWAAGQRPEATTILRRADLVRNPYVGTALDVDLSVVSRASGQQLRSSRYTMLTHRNDRTLMLMPQGERGSPGALLIADDTYWLLLPRAERPVELAFRHVVTSDLSHAGFLRVNLRARYEPRYDGEETLGGVPCWRLELEPKSEPAPFGRVRYWVAQRGFLPIRIEFYGTSGELLKTARFASYQDTGSGPRPAHIVIEDTRRPRERATLSLGMPTGVATSRLAFDLDNLAALREAGRRLVGESETSAGGRKLVEFLSAAARPHQHDPSRVSMRE